MLDRAAVPNRHDPRVRHIDDDELELYLPAAAAMFTEELGVSPYQSSSASKLPPAPRPDQGAAGVRHRRERRGDLQGRPGRGVAAHLPGPGVWVRPDRRGRGIGTAALAVVLRTRSPSPRRSAFTSTTSTSRPDASMTGWACARPRSCRPCCSERSDVGVRAVIFDWGGTLTPGTRIDPRGLDRGVADEELAQRLAAAEDEIWARSHDGAPQRQRSPKCSPRPASTAHRHCVAAFSSWWEPHTLTSTPTRRRCSTALRDARSGSACCPTRSGRASSTSGSSHRDGVLRPDRRRGLHLRDRVDEAAPGGVPGCARRGRRRRPGDGGIRGRPAVRRHPRREVGRHAGGAHPAQRHPGGTAGPVQGEPDAVVQRLGRPLGGRRRLALTRLAALPDVPFECCVQLEVTPSSLGGACSSGCFVIGCGRIAAG